MSHPKDTLISFWLHEGCEKLDKETRYRDVQRDNYCEESDKQIDMIDDNAYGGVTKGGDDVEYRHIQPPTVVICCVANSEVSRTQCSTV